MPVTTRPDLSAVRRADSQAQTVAGPLPGSSTDHRMGTPCEFSNTFARICASFTLTMNRSFNRGTHVELYVRSLAPRNVLDGQRAVLEFVEQLAGNGRLSGYTVHVCGREIPATPAETVTDFGEFLLNRVAAFSAWADRNGYSLGTLFDRRTLKSSLTGEHRETIVVPVMALAEYEGPDLRFVTPCSIEGTTVTVQDRLDELYVGAQRDTTAVSDVRTAPAEESPLLIQ